MTITAVKGFAKKLFKCLRCNHEWLQRKNSIDEPKVCPKCKSPYWNTPKRD